MNSTPSDASSPSAPGDRVLPLLLVLFVGSGCAALIYEIVWFQLLALVVGSSAVSLGVLLGTFMGGMCLGSLLLPRLVSPERHPLRVYAWLELGIGAIGLGALWLVPLVGSLYAASASHGPLAIALRGLVAAVCLLPPTLLMGATLPAVARWIEATPRGVSWLGFFYGGNIAGAVLGCLLAGFYLLRVHDMHVATYVAAAINLAVGLLALGLASRTPYRHVPPQPATVGKPRPAVRAAWAPYVVIGLSGFCALGAEVIWTRLLSLLLGGTVYTFSLILAVFLVGLGIGSSGGSLIARSSRSPRTALGICQLLLTAAIAWSAWQLAVSLPYWPIEPALAKNPWHVLQLDILRSAWVLMPAAVLWGASFPLALASAAAPGEDAGRLVGGVYAANTVGAIGGALAFSILLVGWIGTQDSQRILIVLAGASAMLSLASALAVGSPRIVAGLGLLAAAGMGAGFAITLPPTSSDLIAYGRNAASEAGRGKIVFQGEGMNSSVAVTQLASGVRNFHVSGKIEASSEPQDMRLQRMLGHIPALVHPQPKSVLVVGCGAGVTAGSFVAYPSVERIVICEIEPLIPQVVAKHFGPENYEVAGSKLRDQGLVKIVYDDARHFMLTTNEKFDIITSDPINPWVKGAATLYTEEYFDLCKRRLKPGGVVTQWVPLYESNDDAVKSELATFFRVFPNSTVWGNDIDGFGYDLVLLGTLEPATIDVEGLQTRLDSLDHTLVAFSLADAGFGSALDLLATYAGQPTDMTKWLAGAEINRDRNLRLQYLAGLGVNEHSETGIYNDLLADRQFPEKLLKVSAVNRALVLRRLGFRN
jgi:spermidine synthase